MNTKHFPSIAAACLRIGLSAVYLWFGFQQFLHSQQWVGYIPSFIVDNSPVDAITLVHFNGAIEIVFGVTLLLGIYTRMSALVLGIHMAHITAIVGYDSIGVRDFGLFIGTVAVAFYGSDVASLETYLGFRQRREAIIKEDYEKMITPKEELIVNAPHLVPPPPPFDVHSVEKITEHIRELQSAGKSEIGIRSELFNAGCSLPNIEKAYEAIIDKKSVV
ncbi:MAG: DoxX [Candidatus Parcubacteria bacterium]|jgi:uncharacterized membrane protein YphA (DoxX/SURF4 family)